MTDITPFILPMISAGALLISIISLCYTYQQNRRHFEVNLWLEHKKRPKICLTAFKSGYRPISIINGVFLANNEELKIWDKNHEVDREKYGPKAPQKYYATIECNFNSPQTIKEGEIAVCSITTRQIAAFLYYNDYSGVVKLSGYFETVHREKKYTKSIDFDIENYFIK